jgi:hypothetical protein
MSTSDKQSLSATDPIRQDDLASTLNNIMAQLTTISNILDLQGSTLAGHVQLLDGTEGSTTSGDTPPSQNGATSSVPATGAGNGGGKEVADGAIPHTHQPPPCDYHDDLWSMFHQPKLKFPRYDGDSNPLPWLNHCESFFRGTQTLTRNVTTLWSANMASCLWRPTLKKGWLVLTRILMSYQPWSIDA